MSIKRAGRRWIVYLHKNNLSIKEDAWVTVLVAEADGIQLLLICPPSLLEQHAVSLLILSRKSLVWGAELCTAQGHMEEDIIILRTSACSVFSHLHSPWPLRWFHNDGFYLSYWFALRCLSASQCIFLQIRIIVALKANTYLTWFFCPITCTFFNK